MKGIFRGLVVGGLLIQALLFFSPYGWPYIYSDEELNLLSWHGLGASYDVFGVIPYAFVIAYIVVSLGLLAYQSWLRIAFLILTIVGILLMPFSGLQVYAPYDNPFASALGLMDGAILAILFLTEFAKEFQSSANGVER